MSLIADALKKVQRERQAQGPEEAGAPIPPAAEASPRLRPRLIVPAVLAALLAVAGFWLLLQPGRSLPKLPPLSQRPPEAASPLLPAVGLAVSSPKRTPESAPAPATKPKRPAPAAEARKPTVSRPLPPPVQAQPVRPAAPDSYDDLMRQGRDLQSRGDDLLAVEKFRQALALRSTPEAYVFAYASLMKQGNPALARAYVQEGVAAFPESLPLIKILVNLDIRERRFAEALRRIGTVAGPDAALLTYSGLCRFHLGDFDSALGDFRASLEKDGSAVENYYYLGLIFDNRKEYPRALWHYRRFLELNPQNRYFRHREWIDDRIRLLEAALGSGGRP